MSELCRVGEWMFWNPPLDSESGKLPLRCKGPRVACLLGVTKEQVEKAAPHGVWRYPIPGDKWRPVRDGYAYHCAPENFLRLPDLLHRLSTQECPVCRGKGDFSDRDSTDGSLCGLCNGTGRIGTVCSGAHLPLVTPSEESCPSCAGSEGLGYRCRTCDGTSLATEPPRLDPAQIPLDESARTLLAGLGLETEAPS